MKSKNIIIVIVSIAVLFLVGYGFDVLSKNSKTNDTNTTTNATAVQVDPVNDTDHILGDANAPITLIEYSDFQCPYCITHYPTMQKLISNNPGKVKWVFRHFPLSFHQAAEKAAEASEAAGAQGKFWEYSDMLAKNSKSDGSGLAEADLIRYAGDLGLDVAKFTGDLDSGKYKDKVSKDQASGEKAKVEGTPATFLIDKGGKTELISGALPLEQLQAKVNSAIK